MASNIDPTKPLDGVPAEKADLRANLQAAKTEIEAQQALTDALQAAQVPVGGSTGQVLKKTSAANYDFGWAPDLTADPGSGGGEFVNVVRDHGAVAQEFIRGGGGGVTRVVPTTDNTAAIQAAIDSIGGQGGTVYIPPGAYGVRTLFMRPRVHLMGAGKSSVLFLLGGTPEDAQRAAAGAPNECPLLRQSTNTSAQGCPDEGYWITNLTLNANFSGQNGAYTVFAIRIQLAMNETRILEASRFTAQTPRNVIQNVWVQDAHYGIYFRGFGENQFDNIQGEYCLDYGFYLDSFDNWVSNCSFGDTGTAAFHCHQANNRFFNCKGWFCGQPAAGTKAGHAFVVQSNTNTFVGCEAQDTYGDAFVINGRFNQLVGCYADGVGSLGGGGNPAFHPGLPAKTSYGYRFGAAANWNSISKCFQSDRYVRDGQGGPYGEYTLGVPDNVNCHHNRVDITAPVGHQAIGLLDITTAAAGRNPGLVINGGDKSMPTSDPAITGAFWNDAGTLKISSGTSTSISDDSTTLLADAPSGTTVLTLNAVGEPPITYSITGGNAAGHFTIVGNELRTTATYVGNALASYSLTVQASNAGGSDTATVTITRVTLGAAAFTDAFNRADQNLEASASWTLLSGLAGGAAVRSNQLAALAGSGQISTYQTGTDVGSTNQWARWNQMGVGSNASFVCLRMLNTSTYIAVRHNADAGAGLQLYKATGTAGAWANVDQTNQLLTAGQQVTVTAVGDTVTIYVNGARRLVSSLGGTNSTGTRQGVVPRVTVLNPWLDDLSFGAM